MCAKFCENQRKTVGGVTIGIKFDDTGSGRERDGTQTDSIQSPTVRAPSATSTTVTGPARQRLQTGTEDAPVLDRSAPLRRLRVSGAGYKYPDLLSQQRSYNGKLLQAVIHEDTIKQDIIESRPSYST